VSIVVVLNRPKNRVNVASVIRAMKNFSLTELRLVSPAEFDPHRLEGIAHNTGDIIEQTVVFEDLQEALSDCIHVVGLTSRFRAAKRNVQSAREAAPEIVSIAEVDTAALVLGPEDKGLTNDELDLCHRSVTIDTSDEHPSLNLAQAFILIAYELFLARGMSRSIKPPRRPTEPATHADIELLCHDIQQALESVEFFKSRKPRNIMRTVRELSHRVPVDKREVKLLRAMALEVMHFLIRKGAT